MHSLLSYRVRVIRNSGSAFRSVGRAGRLLLTGIGLTALAATLAAPASAQVSTNTGNVSATIPVFIKVYSVNVNPGAFTFANCKDNLNASTPQGLTLPNGTCDSGQSPITVTNSSNVNSHVFVQGAAARPNAGTTNWALCDPAGGAAPQCTNINQPGPDQYQMGAGNVGSLADGAALAPQANNGPDTNFGLAGAAAAGQTVGELLKIEAPSTTVDSAAASFTTSVTWVVSG